MKFHILYFIYTRQETRREREGEKTRELARERRYHQCYQLKSSLSVTRRLDIYVHDSILASHFFITSCASLILLSYTSLSVSSIMTRSIISWSSPSFFIFWLWSTSSYPIFFVFLLMLPTSLAHSSINASLRFNSSFHSYVFSLSSWFSLLTFATCAHSFANLEFACIHSLTSIINSS